MSLKSKAQEIREKFDALLADKSEEQETRHAALMLMAGYLSEIEKIQKQKGLKRNRLAELIKTSASYLTQVFRGDKPLNFETIAKIQKALDIRFTVTAHYQNEIINEFYNRPMSDVYYKNFSHLYYDPVTKPTEKEYTITGASVAETSN
jgi:transcriptional regulator with XRE-family HTH domain